MTEHHRPDGPFSWLGLATVAATIAIDQGSKQWAEASLTQGEAVDVLPILSLYRVHNPGIAFSFLADFGVLPLIVITIAITLVVLSFWRTATEGGRWATVGYALIIGGALGNLVDRIIHGHVVDFLLLHIGDRTLFVFNLADAALTLGPAILILVYVWPRRPGDRDRGEVASGP
jgi:signal peptidase II